METQDSGCLMLHLQLMSVMPVTDQKCLVVGDCSGGRQATAAQQHDSSERCVSVSQSLPAQCPDPRDGYWSHTSQ